MFLLLLSLQRLQLLTESYLENGEEPFTVDILKEMTSKFNPSYLVIVIFLCDTVLWNRHICFTSFLFFLLVYYLFQTFVKSFLQMSNRGSGLLPVVLIRFVYSRALPRKQWPKLKCKESVVACRRWLLNSIFELEEVFRNGKNGHMYSLERMYCMQDYNNYYIYNYVHVIKNVV